MINSRKDLNKIKETVLNSDTSQSECPTTKALKRQQLETESLKNKSIKQDINLRNTFAQWTMFITSCFLFILGWAIVYLVVKGLIKTPETITALLATTTIHVLGLPYLVIKSLFPQTQSNKKSQ